MQQEDYLIKSRKGFNNPIGRNMAYRVIKGTCKIYGITNVGTHTLRKTFGYKHYLDITVTFFELFKFELI